MKIKNVIASAAFAFVVLNPYTYKVKAADVNQTVKNFAAKANVSLNKTWTVKFNSEVDENTIGDNIKVVDKTTGNPVNVTVKLNSDKQSVEIEAPSSGYDVDENYSLSVGNKIANLKGKNLTQGAELDFTTAAIKSTDSLKDVNTTVGTMPSLPSSINAILTDGTTKAFDITWNSLSQSDISKEGTIALQGTLKGTNYKVSVNVIVGSAEDPNITILKQLSAKLETIAGNVSSINEKNAIMIVKAAIDDKIANPTNTLNTQPVKEVYYGLTPAERGDLINIMYSNFSQDELAEAEKLLL